MMAFRPQPTPLVPPYQTYYGYSPTQTKKQDCNSSFQDNDPYQQDSADYKFCITLLDNYVTLKSLL